MSNDAWPQGPAAVGVLGEGVTYGSYVADSPEPTLSIYPPAWVDYQGLGSTTPLTVTVAAPVGGRVLVEFLGVLALGSAVDATVDLSLYRDEVLVDVVASITPSGDSPMESCTFGKFDSGLTPGQRYTYSIGVAMTAGSGLVLLMSSPPRPLTLQVSAPGPGKAPQLL